MKKHIATLMLTFTFLLGNSQQFQFRTILPNKAVVAGESFAVQYVINNNAAEGFFLPVFHGFRVVTGPDIYPGESKGSAATSKNFMVTIVALKPGRYLIPGATVRVHGKIIRSNDNFIEVISRKANKLQINSETGSGYYLSPGESVADKLNKNLFVKVMVDKRKCYVGEPVTATFKLYSRLESKSDIVKNPGFYGFTVFDVVNLSDRIVGSEKINGKMFDVHTIRKVQLYPLSAGRFNIDPMEVRNTVEFSRSLINKMTEQEISEGVLHQDDYKPATGSEIAENAINTETIPVDVIALPDTNKPEEFNGAVGKFTISSGLNKMEVAKNEKGILEIIVSGQGNFTQLNPLPVAWPKGVEGFDPVIEDSLDAESIPLKGYRIFRYPFIASTSDSFVIPSVKFTFFNPDTGQYKTVASPAVSITVHKESPRAIKTESYLIRSKKDMTWIVLLISGAIILGITAYWKSRNTKSNLRVTEIPVTHTIITAGDALAGVSLVGIEKVFYETLYAAIWLFLRERTDSPDLPGSIENLKAIGVNDMIFTRLCAIISECESAIYTGAAFEPDRENMIAETHRVLSAIESGHSEYL